MDRKIRLRVTSIVAFLFSLCFLIGQSYDKLGTWQMIKESPFLSAVKFCAVLAAAFVIINLLYKTLGFISSNKQVSNNLGKYIFDKKPFIFPWIVIMIFWLPNFLLYLPGCLTVDAMKQLEQFFTGELTNHHPILTTMLEGMFVLLGKILGNIEIGLVVYLGLLFICSSSVFALGFRWMNRHEVSYKIRWIGLLYFCLFPLWSSYARTLVKDSLYYPIYFLFILCLFDIALEKDSYFSHGKKIIKFLIICVLLCLVRHNGIYVIMTTLPGIIYFCKKNRKRVCLLFMFLIVSWEAYGLIISTIGIKPGGRQEMLSIPFQQTARYVKYHGKEINGREKQAINNVLDFEKLADNYDPNISDPVKNTYKKQDKYLVDYFKVWGRQFLKHPSTYFQATLNGTYGYYSYKKEIKYPYGYYKQPVSSELYQTKYRIKFVECFKSQRAAYEAVIQRIFDYTPLKLLTQPMLYNWIYIILFGFFIQNRKLRRYWILFIPFFVSFFICIASPVNGDIRYMLPICSTWILYIAFINNRLTERG